MLTPPGPQGDKEFALSTSERRRHALCGISRGSEQEDRAMKRQLKRVLFVCILAILAVGLKYSSGKAHPRIKSLVKRCAAVVAPRSVFAQGVTVLWSADMDRSQEDRDRLLWGSGMSRIAAKATTLIRPSRPPIIMVVASITAGSPQLAPPSPLLTAAPTQQC